MDIMNYDMNYFFLVTDIFLLPLFFNFLDELDVFKDIGAIKKNCFFLQFQYFV